MTRDVIDSIIKSKEGEPVIFFIDFLEQILKRVNLSVYFLKTINHLVVSSNKPDERTGYVIACEIFFYLKLFEQKELILFIKTASEKKIDDLQIGSNINTGKWLDLNSFSDYITSHINDNICFSPELFDFIRAGRISQELKEARRTTRLAVISVVISAISLFISCLHQIIRFLSYLGLLNMKIL